MSMPDGTTTVVPADDTPLKPAYLVRFPEDVWAQLEKSALEGGSVQINCDDGMHLEIPGSAPIRLTTQSSGSTSEIYTLAKDTLTPLAIAASRLTLPLSSASTSKAADRLKAQNDAHDKERKDRADRVNGHKKAVPPSLHLEHTAMARTTSSPATSTPSTPMVPLKTRVVQLLALGPSSIDDIVGRVGMSEGEVMRVVRVVGRETPEGWTLQPSKYSQVKIGQWKYTYAEKQRVLTLAKAAFDELELPEDADERADLDRKEAEVMSGGSSSSERIETPPPTAASAVGASMASPAPTPLKKPAKAGLSLIGKQKAKFAAEKRAASLPNVKKANGTASPRLDPVVVEPKPKTEKKESTIKESSKLPPPLVDSPKTSTKAASPAPTTSSEESVKLKSAKRKREDEAASTTKKGPPPKKTSTSSSEEPRGRSTQPKATAGVKKKKSRPSRDYSSSESDGSPRPSVKRKPPPIALVSNGERGVDATPDPEALRERYEELFPAYQLLTGRLAQLHRDAEAEEEGEVVEMDQQELTKMVARWEKWHHELEGIRKWFAA